MKKRTSYDITINALCIDTKQLQQSLNSGYQTAIEIGNAANARIQVGKRVLWNKERIRRYLESVYDAEGEKDADTLKSKGYVAVTAGGVIDWQSDFAQVFKGADVYILAYNDEPGKRLANRVQFDLQGIAKSERQ